MISAKEKHRQLCDAVASTQKKLFHRNIKKQIEHRGSNDWKS
jgi:hypothetical protein